MITLKKNISTLLELFIVTYVIPLIEFPPEIGTTTHSLVSAFVTSLEFPTGIFEFL